MIDSKQARQEEADNVVNQYAKLCSSFSDFNKDSGRVGSILYAFLHLIREYSQLYSLIQKLLILSQGQAFFKRFFR